eukprot:7387691-Prymnesium_polylepis.2
MSTVHLWTVLGHCPSSYSYDRVPCLVASSCARLASHGLRLITRCMLAHSWRLEASPVARFCESREQGLRPAMVAGFKGLRSIGRRSAQSRCLNLGPSV